LENTAFNIAFNLQNPSSMRLLFFQILLFSALGLHAQFGVQTSAIFNDASPDFITGVGELPADEFETGGEVALNYWFRLPKQRIEFLPTVRYATSKFGLAGISLREFGADMKVNIYPFDFLGDCDCPTFGKQGPQLQKGFFLQASGGYSFYNSAFTNALDEREVSNGNAVVFGGAIGLDIGLSNLLTLTPIVGARFATSAYRDTVFTDPDGLNETPSSSKLTTLHAGLLVSFRFDHKNY